MRKTFVGPLMMAFALSMAVQTSAQTPAQTPPGVATDVTNAEIQGAIQKTIAAAVSDQQLRVVSINGEYNVGVGVLHRKKAEGASGIEHSEITEIYHMMQGSATLVTGGTLENPKAAAPDSSIVKVLNGPSTTGGKIVGGQSRKLSVGDVVVIPPNTPHWFSEFDSDIVYLVVRVDPRKVLPAGYVLK